MTADPDGPDQGRRDVVISNRPAGPDGRSPSISARSGTSSSTTSQGRSVLASQLTNRPAAEARAPGGSAPVAAAAASAYAASTEAWSVALTHTSRSTAPDRHRVAATEAASWVLPLAPSQLLGPSATCEPGTSSTDEPGTSALNTVCARSARPANPGARGGSSPIRARRGGGVCRWLLPPACLAAGFECATTAASHVVAGNAPCRRSATCHRCTASPEAPHALLARPRPVMKG